MIQLNITDPVPQRAEDILNTLVDAYKEDIVNDKNTVARNTERFVVDRLAILEKELGNVDNQIASYRSANQLIDGTQSGLYLQRADQFQNEAVQLQTELELTRYLKEFLLQPKNDKSLIPANIGVSETNLVSQIAEYNKMRLQCDKLESTTAVENPVVQDLQQALLSLRESILRTMDNHIEALQLRLRSTVQQEVRSTGKAANIPNQQKVVLSAERQQKVKEQLYVYLLQKREENALAEYIAESNARVIDRAKGANLPVSPKTQMIYLAALILGLALPTAVIFLMMVMDTKVRNRKDVENKLTMPFLGDIPYHSWEKGKAHDTVVRARRTGCRDGSFPNSAYECGLYERRAAGALQDYVYFHESGCRKDFCNLQSGQNVCLCRQTGATGGSGCPEGIAEPHLRRPEDEGHYPLSGGQPDGNGRTDLPD